MKIALIIAVLSLLASCRTLKEKEVTHEIYRDSIRYIERVKIDTLKIKADTVALYIDCNEPKKQPQTKRSGRSSMVVEPSEKGYIITATCDSLERLVISYEKTLFNLRMTDQKESLSKNIGLTTWQSFQIWTGRLALLFLLGYVALKRQWV